MPLHSLDDHRSSLITPPSRRLFLLGLGAAGLTATATRVGQAQTPAPRVDHTIRIAPTSLELAPGKVVRTTAYNGTVPGPTLRLREGKPVAINVINDAGYPDLVHWHGVYMPSVQDGATEEGSPIIPSGQSHLYSFTPKPAGTRWYHSHAAAGTDLNKSTYSGELGQHARHQERAPAQQRPGGDVPRRDAWGSDAWARRAHPCAPG